MLSRKPLVGPDKLKALEGCFLVNLLAGHFVQQFDGYRGILQSVFYPDYLTSGFERTVNLGHHLMREGKFMVHIDHEHKID